MPLLFLQKFGLASPGELVYSDFDFEPKNGMRLQKHLYNRK